MILIRSNETQCRLRRSVKDGVFFNPDEKEVQNWQRFEEQKKLVYLGENSEFNRKKSNVELDSE